MKQAQDETFAGPPLVEASNAAAPDNKGRQLLQVGGLRAGANTLFGSVTAAKVGVIPNALGLPGVTTDMSLKDHAPGREPSRFMMLLPDALGAGLVAVENVGRSCPAKAIQYALTQMSIREGIALGPLPDGTPRAHLRVKLTAVSDPDHLEQVVKANNAAEIHLTRRGLGVGRGRESKDIEMFAAAISPKRVAAVVGVLNQWRTAKKKGKQVSDRDGAAALARIVGGDNLANIDFDEGQLVLDDNGRPKMVTPALIEEVFTYPLAGRLGDKDWFHTVAAQAQKTVQGSDVAVAWPTWAQLHTVQ